MANFTFLVSGESVKISYYNYPGPNKFGICTIYRSDTVSINVSSSALDSDITFTIHTASGTNLTFKEGEVFGLGHTDAESLLTILTGLFGTVASDFDVTVDNFPSGFDVNNFPSGFNVNGQPIQVVVQDNTSGIVHRITALTNVVQVIKASPGKVRYIKVINPVNTRAFVRFVNSSVVVAVPAPIYFGPIDVLGNNFTQTSFGFHPIPFSAGIAIYATRNIGDADATAPVQPLVINVIYE